MMADTNKTLVFSAERGFHVHRDVWKPLENEELEYLFERHNIFDMFSVKTCCLEDGQIVGHLCLEEYHGQQNFSWREELKLQ